MLHYSIIVTLDYQYIELYHGAFYFIADHCRSIILHPYYALYGSGPFQNLF